MLDAVCNFATRFEECCRVANQVLLGDVPRFIPDVEDNAKRVVFQYPQKENLNASQNAAVQAALDSPLTCLWGPPGTGKTETIVEIIRALQICFDKPRILVTAPTHNAVDNVMRRYLGRLDPTVLANNPHLAPLRVSTEVRKVAEDLRKYTCDARVGQEIHANRKALDQAKKQVRECRIIFTTCIGAGLGLLRSKFDDLGDGTRDLGKMNLFDIVIVDEASQQTEPESLVPLVKGCEKAILVGDHVQLRPTVHQHSLAMEFDKSLFERLITQPTTTTTTTTTTTPSPPPFLSRLMLDTQYRMHPTISTFSSIQFYASNLLTGIPRTARPLFASSFPWPPSPTDPTDLARMIFINCSAREDLGAGKSKTNAAQADLSLRICQLLCNPSPSPSPNPTKPYHTQTPQSIALLTPYARQADLLRRLLAPLSATNTVEVSSIDGFQGREADVVVLVTVRSNESGEIGFLRDERRMNVALTRARAGVVVVGCRGTLTGPTRVREREGDGEGGRGGDDDGKGLWRILVGGLVAVDLELEGEGEGVGGG
jgi:regulator of nonsense transcripts 1